MEEMRNDEVRVRLTPIDDFHAYRTGMFIGMLLGAGFKVEIQQVNGFHSTKFVVEHPQHGRFELVMLPGGKR